MARITVPDDAFHGPAPPPPVGGSWVLDWQYHAWGDQEGFTTLAKTCGSDVVALAIRDDDLDAAIGVLLKRQAQLREG